MKSILYVFLLLIGVLYSCDGLSPVNGNSKIITADYDYSDFTEIDVSNSFEVELVQSEEYQVRVSCNENFKDYLSVTNKDGVLSIKMKSGHTYSNSDLSATISMPQLSKVDANGASVVKLRKFKVDNLELSISGASEVTGKVTIKEELIVDASGASSVDLDGKVKNTNIELSGASSMDSKKLTVSDLLEVDCSGASDVTIKSNGEMKIDLSGASSFNYYGKGKIVEQDISGVSSIKYKGEELEVNE